MTAPRSSYADATHAYSETHEHALTEAIMTAIAETSRVTDLDCMVLRTGEAASALLSCLGTVLAMSPAATRSPTAQRRMLDELGKRLRRRVAAAESCAEVQDFVRRAFRSTDVGGHA
jgi:hypothetical protein